MLEQWGQRQRRESHWWNLSLTNEHSEGSFSEKSCLCFRYSDRLMMPTLEIYEFPFDWSGLSRRAVIMSWARKRLSVVEENKSPLHVASRAIAYDFDWLCIAERAFFSPTRRLCTAAEDLFRLSRGFSRMMAKESDNQMMELKPRVIRQHNLRWRRGDLSILLRWHGYK